ncbi:DMT family transporter [Siccirubricoccus sp. G192]|uniref:DMT family transporter n=1 Tax=Siccirubricoccus sp. G192 TaxID=2849651 RepID=UPI001C2BB262|nr:DMT family transporter [Siccirubricoccus sp. G192]MBV1797469.1 DMT family transporter [Siccirubricoccus sp. G192]
MAGFGLGLLFVAIWASAFTAIRGVVPEWQPLTALAVRFVIVTPILAAIVLWRRGRWPGRADALRLVAMGVFGTAGYLAGAWMAGAILPTGLVALLCATAPLFVAAGEVLVLRRELPGLAWLGLGLGWLGVAVLGLGRAMEAGMPGGLATAAGGLGLLLALGGALSQAVGILAFAPARARLDPWTVNAGQSGVAALALLLLAVLAEPHWPGPPSLTLVLAMVWSVLVVGVGGYALYFVMLRRLPPASAASLQLLAPPLAAVFGWALLGERLGWWDVAGGAVTLAGLALLFRARRV